jgi:hypothetical protein
MHYFMHEHCISSVVENQTFYHLYPLSSTNLVNLVTCDDFTCFEAYGDYKIDSLFTEYVKLSDKQEPLVFPLIQTQSYQKMN